MWVNCAKIARFRV